MQDRTYSSYFYEIELWYNYINRNRGSHNISVGYYKAVTRIVGLFTWDSNHLACESVDVNTIRHLPPKRMFNFYLSIITSENKLIMSLKYYFFMNNSFINNNNNRVY